MKCSHKNFIKYNHTLRRNAIKFLHTKRQCSLDLLSCSLKDFVLNSESLQVSVHRHHSISEKKSYNHWVGKMGKESRLINLV